MSTTPSTLGTTPSFGFGDRLGAATPGHLDALRRAGGPIKGIFAQQSIREMTRTQRTPRQVMAAAADALAAEGFDDVWGADADHLRTAADVDYTAEAGFVFYTIDPSGAVDQQADNYDAATLAARFAAVRDEVDWVDAYAGKTLGAADKLKIRFDRVTVERAAVKYGRAIVQALSLGAHIKKVATRRGQDYEMELSVDETDQPTTLAEHYIIADQCRRHGLKLVSLAPRFIGELEKGVDYKGDLAALERSLADHAALARELGPYKLSLHSGSDKISMYRLFSRATRGMFHVKTAGTSYLEALRVVAIHEPALFRRIIDFSRSRYDTDKATYHVSATVGGTAAPASVRDDRQLQQLYLENWDDVPADRGFTAPGRQILHCTFGSVLTDAELGKAVHQVVRENPQTYQSVLADHFVRHLQPLAEG